MTTIVAVHGNGGGGFRFSRMSEHLPENVRFHAVTLPGFGGRPVDADLTSVGDYAETLWEEVRHLPRPLIVLGHGIGGSIALSLLQSHPVDGLILHAPVGTRLDRRLFPLLMRPAWVRRVVRWGISSKLTRPLLRRRFFGGRVPRDYADRFLAEYGRAEAFGQMFDIITREWWETLEVVDIPAVMLWGAEDRVLGADQLEDYLRLLPSHTVDVVPGWGHFPMATQPHEYTARVVDWAHRLSRGDTAGFTVLGSGTGEAAGLAPKASLLDRAARSGLPVPTGIIIGDGREISELPAWLHGPVAVRSAFGSEDGATSSMTGHFDTVLRVAEPDVPAAIAKVRASGPGTRQRRDLLVMEMVDAVVSGVAFSEPGYADDLIEWTEGTSEHLVAGATIGNRERLARLDAGERAGDEAWRGRLADLLQGIRGVFGDSGWDVEWADDGTRCWLIQVRPVTVPTRRDDWFTMANHREILPDPPSVFMTSLIAEGSAELFDYYRRFDPSLGGDRLFIEVFDHRPMINLSLLTDFMRSLGLPTRLVTDALGGGTETDHGWAPRKLARRLPVLLRLAWAQAGSGRYVRNQFAAMEHLTATDPPSITEAVNRARQVYVRTVHGMTALNTAAALPTGMLRAAGTLAAHGARQETEATTMFRALDALRLLLTPDDREKLATGGWPLSERFRTEWATWIGEYGHRGPYESDLARPRYAEDPTPIIDVLVAGRPFEPRRPRWDLRQVLTLPLWFLARLPMARRERFRSEAMMAFNRVRQQLLRLADDRGVAAETLWLLTSEEVRRLDEGWEPTHAHIESRKAEVAEAKNRAMPDVISRFGSHLDPGNEGGGIGLVAGVVEGRAWVLAEPATRPPSHLFGEPVVLIAPSVDAGWLPTFALVDGVAVEMGGDLSHGSIILREAGLPAATNLAGLRHVIETGDRVRLDGSSGSVALVGTDR